MPEPLRLSFLAMACDCEVQVHAADPAVAEAAAGAAIAEVRRIEAKYSRYQPHSVLSQINAAAGLASTIIDPETAGLLDYGAACWAQSDGAFDLTSGVLRRAWDFRGGAVPPQERIDALLPLVGWDKVRWTKPDLFLSRRGMELDLGGVAKEYAADTAAAAGLAAGAEVCLVNLGGDVRVTGPHPDGRPWSVGIRHPRQPDSLAARVLLSSGGLATSGDYERAVIRDGIRYCHILDPRSGWPVTAAPSVTVVAPVCMVAGSLSTMAMLAGPDATALLESAGLPWLLLDEQGQGRGPLMGKD
jgi:thiamine biosynthesis lipoprotein